ncbi:MAG: BatD family protein [Spirochaetaceae bacterium]|jgi:hypothetical protein|nr:BatD family protein [Spirochaetaceae bacterium]
MKWNRIGRIFLLTLVFQLGLAAEDLQLTINQKQAVVGQALVLELVYNGSGQLSQPSISGNEDYQLSYMGTSRNSSIQIINGKRQRNNQVSLRWQLIPLKIGTLEIPSIEMNINDDILSSNSLQIVVGEAGTVQGFELYYEAQQSMGFPGQPIRVDVIFALKGRVNNLQFHLPLLNRNDITVEPIKDNSSQDIRVLQIQGKEFYCPISAEYFHGDQFTTLRVPFYLIPQNPGTLELAPVTLSFDEEVGTDHFMRAVYDSRVVGSEKLVVEVQPLPREIVQSPNGILLAKSTLKGSLDLQPRQLRVGDPLEMTLSIEGLLFPQRAQLPQPEDFINLVGGVSFSPLEAENRVDSQGVLVLRKKLRITGNAIETKPLELVYFNLELSNVETLILEVPQLDVTGGDSAEPEVELWQESGNQDTVIKQDAEPPFRISYSVEELIRQPKPLRAMPIIIQLIVFFTIPVFLLMILMLPHIRTRIFQNKTKGYPWHKAQWGGQALDLFNQWKEQNQLTLDHDQQKQIQTLQQRYFGGNEGESDHWLELDNLARQLEGKDE